jgi:hypothetical protein
MNISDKCAIEAVTAAESETGHDEVYIVFDGKRIAKRGHPGTPQAKTWVSLNPRYHVRDVNGGFEVHVKEPKMVQ